MRTTPWQGVDPFNRTVLTLRQSSELEVNEWRGIGGSETNDQDKERRIGQDAHQWMALRDFCSPVPSLRHQQMNERDRDQCGDDLDR